MVVAPQCQQQKISRSFVFCLCCGPDHVPFFTLAMSDEIAQDEEDAEDYDLEAIQHRSQMRDDDDDDDAATLVGGRHGNPSSLQEEVVFEIGDEDDEDDDNNRKKKPERLSGENQRGREERQGLMAD